MSHCHFHSFNQYSLSAYCVPDCLLCATTHPGDTCYWLWYVQPSERKIGWTNLCHLTVQGHGPEWLINTSKVTEQVSHNIGTRTQLILVSKSRLPLLYYIYISQTVCPLARLGSCLLYVPHNSLLRSSLKSKLARVSALLCLLGGLFTDLINYSVSRF